MKSREKRNDSTRERIKKMVNFSDSKKRLTDEYQEMTIDGWIPAISFLSVVSSFLFQTLS